MASKIKVTPSVLTDQANRLNSLVTGDLQTIMNKTNKAASLMMDSIVGKFMGNAHTKTTAISRQYSNLYDTLYTGVMVLQESAKLFANSDKDLTKDLDNIWAEVPDVCYVPPLNNANSTNAYNNGSTSTSGTTGKPQETYQEIVERLNSCNIEVQEQLYSLKDNHVKDTGICNISSVTTLLNRKLALDGKNDEKFSVQNSFDANGVVIKEGPIGWYNSNGRYVGETGYVYSGNTGSWGSKTYTNDNGTSYTAKSENKVTIDSNMQQLGITSYDDYIVKLLHEHPEGICLRNSNANHVAVITHYEMIDGKVQFYVQDPVNAYSGKLEGSYLYSNSSNNIFNGLDFITYLQ